MVHSTKTETVTVTAAELKKLLKLEGEIISFATPSKQPKGACSDRFVLIRLTKKGEKA